MQARAGGTLAVGHEFWDCRQGAPFSRRATANQPMGAESPDKLNLSSRACACLVLSCLIGTAGAEEAAVKPKVRFASERPRLRPVPLFGSRYEEGVAPNKFNDGGEVTIQKNAPAAPKK